MCVRILIIFTLSALIKKITFVDLKSNVKFFHKNAFLKKFHATFLLLFDLTSSIYFAGVERFFLKHNGACSAPFKRKLSQ